jgi:hypothetical protein
MQGMFDYVHENLDTKIIVTLWNERVIQFWQKEMSENFKDSYFHNHVHILEFWIQ